MKRRCFLKIIGNSVFAAGLVHTIPPQLKADSIKNGFIESSYGSAIQKSNKILVAYASRCGSTGEVAELIGQALAINHTAVDVRMVENVRDLTPYSAVIIGSAIRYDKWLPEAIDFLRKNRNRCRHLFVAYFITCLALHQNTPKNRRKAAVYLNTARTILEPAKIGMFAGKLDLDTLNFYERLLFSMFQLFGVQEGDFRDWKAIRSWAETIKSEIPVT